MEAGANGGNPFDMDFSWTPEQDELYERSLAFARSELSTNVTDRERDHRFDRSSWDKAAAFGLGGLSVPEEFGGMGLDAVSSSRVLEAFGRGSEDAGLLFSFAAHLFACAMPIAEHASSDLAASMLPRLARGEWIGANAISEAEAGSDVFALKTRARRDGDSYVLDGSKSYVSNAPVADVLLVYAVTEPADGYLGISAFAVPRNTPGVTIGRPFDKVGLTTAPTSTVYFENCRADQLVGERGQGAMIFNRSMAWERTCLFALYVGRMERQLEDTIEFVKNRKQFKKALSKFQAISHRIAEMKLRLETARLLLYRASWALDQNTKDATLAASLSKLFISEAAVASGLDAIQIHGGAGVMTETGIDRALRDALPGRIFSGTSEIQRDIIAKALGL